MIKKKIGVDEQKAFEEACKMNGIKITPYDSNKNPVAYIDYTGEKRMLEGAKKSNENCLNNITVGDFVKVLAKSPQNTRGSIFIGYVMEKDERAGSIALKTRGRSAYAFQKSRLLKLDDIIKAEIIKRKNVAVAKKKKGKGIG